MLQVRRLSKYLPKLNQTVWLLIGTHHIDCALITSGANARWQKLCTVELNTSAGETPFKALCAALNTISHDLSILSYSVTNMRAMIADEWLASTVLPWNPIILNTDTAEVFARKYLIESGVELDGTEVIRIDEASFGTPRLTIAYPALLLRAH